VKINKCMLSLSTKKLISRKNQQTYSIIENEKIIVTLIFYKFTIKKEFFKPKQQKLRGRIIDGHRCQFTINNKKITCLYKGRAIQRRLWTQFCRIVFNFLQELIKINIYLNKIQG